MSLVHGSPGSQHAAINRHSHTSHKSPYIRQRHTDCRRSKTVRIPVLPGYQYCNESVSHTAMGLKSFRLAVPVKVVLVLSCAGRIMCCNCFQHGL